ncbi:DNA repair protein SWI5 homolog [Morphnus guianensis]
MSAPLPGHVSRGGERRRRPPGSAPPRPGLRSRRGGPAPAEPNGRSPHRRSPPGPPLRPALPPPPPPPGGHPAPLPSSRVARPTNLHSFLFCVHRFDVRALPLKSRPLTFRVRQQQRLARVVSPGNRIRLPPVPVAAQGHVYLCQPGQESHGKEAASALVAEPARGLCGKVSRPSELSLRPRPGCSPRVEVALRRFFEGTECNRLGCGNWGNYVLPHLIVTCSFTRGSFFSSPARRLGRGNRRRALSGGNYPPRRAPRRRGEDYNSRRAPRRRATTTPGVPRGAVRAGPAGGGSPGRGGPAGRGPQPAPPPAPTAAGSAEEGLRWRPAQRHCRLQVTVYRMLSNVIWSRLTLHKLILSPRSCQPNGANKEALQYEIKELKQKDLALDQEIAQLLSEGYSLEELEKHISLLHEYNDIKDAGQMLLGKLAVIRGVTTKQLYPEYDLELSD